MSTQISNKPYKILNRDTIKYIAMFTMLLNHIATIFLTPGTWLFEFFLAIGYFTAITMIYFLVEGYHYTHSKKTYISRLFFFALISEIPYCLAFTTNGMIEFYGLNMLFTLCVCFGILYVLDTIKSKLVKGCLVILGIIISLFVIGRCWHRYLPCCLFGQETLNTAQRLHFAFHSDFWSI